MGCIISASAIPVDYHQPLAMQPSAASDEAPEIMMDVDLEAFGGGKASAVSSSLTKPTDLDSDISDVADGSEVDSSNGNTVQSGHQTRTTRAPSWPLLAPHTSVQSAPAVRRRRRSWW